MKTKNRVKKAIASFLFVIISLVLLGVNIQAQNYLAMEFNGNLNSFELAMTDDHKTSSELMDEATKKVKNVKAEFLTDVETEETLEIESWMLDEKVFDFGFSEIEIEKPLELEGWMKNENYFLAKTVNVLVEKEESLKLENWMIEKEIWK